MIYIIIYKTVCKKMKTLVKHIFFYILSLTSLLWDKMNTERIYYRGIPLDSACQVDT